MSEDTLTGGGIGRPARDRKQAFVKLMWFGIWLAFMGGPLSDLFDRGGSPGVVVLGATGLAAFVTVYLMLFFKHSSLLLQPRAVHGAVFFMLALAVLLSVTLGSAWLVLFVYVSVSCGAALPIRVSRLAIPLVTGVMAAVGLRQDDQDLLGALVIPALLGGFAMVGVVQLIRTTTELREARATVAELAANEERLRLARDLHDLLGHSLSLITLKSELAGRMLPEHPDRAAEQVADIEQVSRQALTDVREAVSGYRRPTLPGELAGARTALAAAGVAADVPQDLPAELGDDILCVESETVLAWALREAVTNVVRHSGAHRCVVSLVPRQTLEGRVVELTVEDDGRGASGVAQGNGLTGLGERLAEVGGTLETGSTRAGFLLSARTPMTVLPLSSGT